MAAQTTITTPYFTTPYLSVPEFKASAIATALDVSSLNPGAPQAAQDAALAQLIVNASGFINSYCNQVLSATSDTEQFYARTVDRNGNLIVHPRYWPVSIVTDFRFGSTADPTTWLQLTSLTSINVAPQQIILPPTSFFNFSSVGPLDMSGRAYGLRCWGQFTYVNGWPNTYLTATATAGATSLTVANGTGITAGTYLTIYDAGNQETVQVANTYTVGSTTVPLTAGTQYTHTVSGTPTTINGISVTSLPSEIKQAAIFMTAALIKSRGNEAQVMDPLGGAGRIQAVDGVTEADMEMAYDALEPFRRVR